MNDYRMKPHPCLVCSKPLDACTDLNKGSRPESGDLSICAYCGNLAVFDDQLDLRALTKEENDTMDQSTLDMIAKVTGFVQTRKH